MGRFSEPLATVFADACGISAGQRALDVGCGPGALTAELVRRLGPERVAGVDPSPPFVAAASERFPGVTVGRGAAEDLPFPDDSFDVSLAQLVVHFMADPVRGLAEMGRVTRPGGLVGACVWDNGGGRGPLSPFWRAARELDPAAPDQSGMAGTHAGQLAGLAHRAGLGAVEPGEVSVTVGFATFAEWWDPVLLGVGPVGTYVRGLDAAGLAALKARCDELLPPAPFSTTVSAWTVTARP